MSTIPYKIDYKKTVAKLKILTNKDLELLAIAVDKEFNARLAKNMTAPKITRSRSRSVSSDNTPTVRRLGDPDGDVMWKHHGMDLSEAFDQMCEQEA